MMKINDNVALCLLPAATRSQLLPIVGTWGLVPSPENAVGISSHCHQLSADTLQSVGGIALPSAVLICICTNCTHL